MDGGGEKAMDRGGGDDEEKQEHWNLATCSAAPIVDDDGCHSVGGFV